MTMHKVSHAVASSDVAPYLAGPFLLRLIHPMDPRGNKVGGIETHIRSLLRNYPAGWRLLFIGIDEFGDCEIGKVRKLEFEGRTIEFLPVLRFPQEDLHKAASSIGGSVTFRFLLAMLRHIGALRRAMAGAPGTMEIQRFEFALIPLVLHVPFVQIVHGEPDPGARMDSLLKKYWFVNRIGEWFAVKWARRVVVVHPKTLERYRRDYPAAGERSVFMPVSVDARTFAEAPFDVADGVLRVVFAGRLDEFKDPPTMFRVLAETHRRLGGACEFHYIGTSDPHRYPQFSLVESFTARHGFQTAPDVARIMAGCHIAILTSFFEGMPCFLLESLSVGRPAAVIDLPQFDLVVEEGVSGTVIARAGTDEETTARFSEKLIALWDAIRQGRVSTAAVRAKIIKYSVGVQMQELFRLHWEAGARK